MAKVTDPNPDLSGQFEKDWNDAQTRYKAGVAAGYNEQDANNLFLDPIRAKWKLIGSSPLLQDPAKLKQFNNEFSDANQNFLTNNNTYGRDNGAWAASRTNSILPTLEKWQIESGLPVKRPEQLDREDANIAAGLPEAAVKQAQISNELPINPATQTTPGIGGKPFRLTIPKDTADELQQGYTALRQSGFDAPTAEVMARQLALGTNSDVQPVTSTVTNSPAIPARPKFFGIPFTGSDAVPADTSTVTNAFRINPSGIDPAVSAQVARFPSVQKAFRIGQNPAAPVTAAPNDAAPGDVNGLPPAPSAAPIKVTSKKDFDSIPSGTVYVGANGKKFKKP